MLDNVFAHKFKLPSKQNGQALIELLVTLALASVLLPGLITGFVASREGKAQQSQRLEATALLKEAMEALRTAQETSWSAVLTNGTYHPVVSNNTWQLSAESEKINGYTRQIVISDVNRDLNGNIVTVGGTPDPSTKKAVVSVSWETPSLSNVNTTTYLTRFIRNNAFTQTTVADFNTGSKSTTTITNSAGGEVVLGAGGGGDWCNPNLSISALDLPKSGVANAITAIEGRAFAGTGDNASGVSFANIVISNTDPPTATVAGTFDSYKTNGVYGEANYAYLATDTNSREVEIIDMTRKVNGKYPEAGYYDAPGQGNGLSVFALGNIGFMTITNKLYTFDLSSKTGSRPQLGSVTLAGTGTKVWAVGNYAYVSIAGASVEMQIIQVSNGGRTLSVVGQADVNGQAAYDVFVNSTGTRAYLATAADSSRREFFIVNITSKTGNRPIIGSYEANGMNPKGITVVPGNKAILVGTGGEEYQVIDISNEATPTRCGGLQINAGVNGVSGVLEQDGDAYAYIITGDSAAEFKIIAGGPGGQYADIGIFISSAFDAGSTVAFNRLIPNFSTPNQTNLQFQVAVSNAAICTGATYYFVGPDGTAGTYFTSGEPIPLLTNSQGYSNPGRCIEYKAFFSTSDSTSSPVLYDVSVNYSP